MKPYFDTNHAAGFLILVAFLGLGHDGARPAFPAARADRRHQDRPGAATGRCRGGARTGRPDGGSRHDSLRHLGQLQRHCQARAGRCPAGRRGGLAYAGIRLPLPAGPARPGRKAAVFMLVAWVLAIAAFLACLVVYIQQARREGLAHGLPPDHIFPITFIAAGVTFFIIVIKGRRAARPRSPAPSSARWPGRWSSNSPSTSS